MALSLYSTRTSETLRTEGNDSEKKAGTLPIWVILLLQSTQPANVLLVMVWIAVFSSGMLTHRSGANRNASTMLVPVGSVSLKMLRSMVSSSRNWRGLAASRGNVLSSMDRSSVRRSASSHCAHRL